MKKRKSFKKIMTTEMRPIKLDTTELLLLTFVTVILLLVLGWQMGLLPTVITTPILGASTAR